MVQEWEAEVLRRVEGGRSSVIHSSLIVSAECTARAEVEPESSPLPGHPDLEGGTLRSTSKLEGGAGRSWANGNTERLLQLASDLLMPHSVVGEPTPRGSPGPNAEEAMRKFVPANWSVRGAARPQHGFVSAASWN